MTTSGNATSLRGKLPAYGDRRDFRLSRRPDSARNKCRSYLGFSILALVLSLAIAGPANADNNSLSTEAIQDLLSGATANAKSSRGFNYQIEFGTDGSAAIRADNGFSDDGKWSAEDGHYCTQWQKIRRKEKVCWEVFHKTGNEYHFVRSDGEEEKDMMIVK